MIDPSFGTGNSSNFIFVEVSEKLQLPIYRRKTVINQKLAVLGKEGLFWPQANIEYKNYFEKLVFINLNSFFLAHLLKWLNWTYDNKNVLASVCLFSLFAGECGWTST